MQIRLLLLLFLAVLSGGTSDAQAWSYEATFPGGGYERMFSFSLNGNLYMGGGQGPNNPISYEFWEYAPATGAWTQKANFITGGRRSLSGMAINGKGYAGGGFNGATFTNDWYEYDPVTDIWTPKASFPGQGRSWPVAVNENGKGYYGFGGSTSYTYYSDWYEYDPVNDAWTTLATFPGSARTACAYFAVGGKIYVGMGTDANGWLEDFWAYDIATDSWSQKADYPGGERFSAFSGTLNGFGYVGGGQGGQTSPVANPVDMYLYAPAVNVWSPAPDFLGEGRILGVDWVANNILYVGMGRTYDPPNDNYKSDIWAFNPNPVGREEALNPDAIEVWPTIFYDQLHIRRSQAGIPGSVSMHNLQGQSLLEHTLIEQEFNLNTASLAPGMYLLRIRQGDDQQVRKVIKH